MVQVICNHAIHILALLKKQCENCVKNTHKFELRGLTLTKLRYNIKIWVLCLTPYLSFANELVKGTLVDQKGIFYIQNQEGELKIETSDLILKSLPSLYKPAFARQTNNKPYTFEFNGIKKIDSFRLSEVPTIIPGPDQLKGILLFDDFSKTYMIDGHLAVFGYTKNISGYSFDEISKKFFIGKNLIAEGYFNNDGLFLIQALTPVDLFSATFSDKKIKNAKNFILKEMPKNENSQKETSFRTTLYENQEIKGGDHALIIALSGREGDSFGAVYGHFAAGLAEVKEDLSLRGEISNIYVTNTKDILAGNTSLTNYYSHIVQGQNIYRPTYTMIIYGLNKKILKQYRDSLEELHIKLRTKNTLITPQFNCTTETIKALKDIEVEGSYIQITNYLSGLATYPLKLSKIKGKMVQYALANDPSRYQPTPAFQGLIKTFLSDKARKKLGVKRIDYIFYAQIPSQRPVGGMALESIWKASKFKKLYDMYEVNESTKLSVEDLRIILKDKLNEIPYK